MVTLSGLLKKEGYRLLMKSSKRNQLLRIIDMLLSIIKYRKKINYILIDTYSTRNFYYALACSQLARVFKLKYIPILHGGNLPNRLDSSPGLSDFIFKNSYKNIAPSNYLKVAFENKGYETIFIPNVLDITSYRFEIREEYAPKLLYVRAFDKIYNPKMAVYVLSALLKNYPSAKLCMVGPDKDGSFQECIALAKALGVHTSVEFNGMLSKSEWHKKSEEYDIFINTTNLDNTPVSVMEAMALGLIVLSTNVGGMPYMIKNGFDGVLVPPNKADEMTLAIENLIIDKETTQNMIVNARKKVESFDWSRVKQSWFDIL